MFTKTTPSHATFPRPRCCITTVRSACAARRSGAAGPQLLERVGLADRANEPIARFSKGMIQRLGVAQALINDPELLVLDEPSEGLDLSGRR